MYTGNSAVFANLYTSSQPSSYDYLKPNGFRFVVKELPTVSYTCQRVELPSLDIGFITQATPLQDVFLPDQKPVFGNFSITFIVSENMQNYIELNKWIIALTEIDKAVSDKFVSTRINRYTESKLQRQNTKYSDASLIILNSANNPKIEVKFTDLFPVGLSSLTFDTTIDNIQYFVCTATFKYSSYEIVSL